MIIWITSGIIWAMFYLLMRFLGFWGIFDALWLIVNPRSWNNFWQKRLQAISDKGFFSTALAVGEFFASLWLLKKTRSQ
jgi:hypothetical protein